MEETVELTRPRHVPARRATRSPLLIAAIACGSTVIGFGGALLVVHSALVPSVAPAAKPEPKPEPQAAAPTTPVVAEPEIEPTATNPPRAAAPMLDARCMIGGDQPDLCTWDDGLPAISADDATIVHRRHDAKGTTIGLVDVKTSKVDRTFVLVTADEATNALGDDPAATAARAALAGVVVPRLAKLQDVLDAGHFRPLAYLGADGSAGNDVAVDESPEISATLDGDGARLAGAKDDAVFFQRRITTEPPTAPSKPCSTVAFDGMRVWFDAGAQVLFTEHEFTTGDDDSCPTLEVPRAVTLK